MALHTVFEKPLVSMSGILVRKNTRSLLKMQMIETTYDADAIKATDPYKRNCMTNKESDLSYLRSPIEYK